MWSSGSLPWVWWSLASAGTSVHTPGLSSVSTHATSPVTPWLLTYMYGANQAVEPRIDTRGGDIVVSLSTQSGDGLTPAIGLLGEARFSVFGGTAPVRYPDGEQLPCPHR